MRRLRHDVSYAVRFAWLEYFLFLSFPSLQFVFRLSRRWWRLRLGLFQAHRNLVGRARLLLLDVLQFHGCAAMPVFPQRLRSPRRIPWGTPSSMLLLPNLTSQTQRSSAVRRKREEPTESTPRGRCRSRSKKPPLPCSLVRSTQASRQTLVREVGHQISREQYIERTDPHSPPLPHPKHLLAYLSVHALAATRNRTESDRDNLNVSDLPGTLGKPIQMIQSSCPPPQHASLFTARRRAIQSRYHDLAYLNAFVSFAVNTIAEIGYSEDTHPNPKISKQEPTIPELHRHHPSTRAPHAAGNLIHGSCDKHRLSSCRHLRGATTAFETWFWSESPLSCQVLGSLPVCTYKRWWRSRAYKGLPRNRTRHERNADRTASRRHCKNNSAASEERPGEPMQREMQDHLVFHPCFSFFPTFSLFFNPFVLTFFSLFLPFCTLLSPNPSLLPPFFPPLFSPLFPYMFSLFSPFPSPFSPCFFHLFVSFFLSFFRLLFLSPFVPFFCPFFFHPFFVITFFILPLCPCFFLLRKSRHVVVKV